MLQRLEAKRDPNKRKQWVTDRLQTLKYLSNISAYPVQFIKQRKEMEQKKKKNVEKVKEPTQKLPAI